MEKSLPKRYEIKKTLSKTANSIVLLIWNSQKKGNQALKIVAPDSIFYHGFLQEYLLLKQFKHKNLIEVNHFGFLVDGSFYYEMPYYEQISIASYCQEIGQSGFLRIAYQLLDGLHFLHARNILHGDLSLDNIFFINQDDTPTIKISDFGLSSLLAANSIHDISGKLKYVAPEILTKKGKKQLTIQNDIYALGICFISILSQDYNIPIENPLDFLRQKIISKQADILPEISLDETLLYVIKKMLAYYPENRYRTIEEVFHDLLPLFVKENILEKPAIPEIPYYYHKKSMERTMGKIEKKQIVTLTGRKDEVFETCQYIKAILSKELQPCVEIDNLHKKNIQAQLENLVMNEFPNEYALEEIEKKYSTIRFFIEDELYQSMHKEIDEILLKKPNWNFILANFGQIPQSINHLNLNLSKLSLEEFNKSIELYYGKNIIPNWFQDFLVYNAYCNFHLLKEFIKASWAQKVVALENIQWSFYQEKLPELTLPTEIKNQYLQSLQLLSEQEKKLLDEISFCATYFSMKEISEIFKYRLTSLQEEFQNLKKADIIVQPSPKMMFHFQFVKKHIQNSIAKERALEIKNHIIQRLCSKDLSEYDEMILNLTYLLELRMEHEFISQAEIYLTKFDKVSQEYLSIIEIFDERRKDLEKINPDSLLEKLNIYFTLLSQKRDVEKLAEISEYASKIVKICSNMNAIDECWVNSLHVLRDNLKWDEILAIYSQNKERVETMQNSTKTSLLFLISDAYFASNDLPQAIEFLEKAIPLISKEDITQKIYAIKKMGYYQTQLNDYPAAIELYKQAIDLAEQENQRSETGHLFCLISFIMLERYEIAEAIKFLKKAEKIRDEYKQYKLNPLISFGLGAAYVVDGDFWKALQYNHLCRKQHRSTGNIYFYDDLASTLGNLGYFDIAMFYLQRAVEMCEKNDSIFLFHEFYTFLMEIAVRKEDFMTAKNVLAKMEETESNTRPRILLYAHYIRAKYYIKTKQFDFAKKELDMLSDKYAPYVDITLYYFLTTALYHYELEDFKNALKAINKAYKTLDSIHFTFAEAPEIIYHTFLIQKKAFQRRLTNIDYKKKIIQAYNILQERAKKLPTIKMRRHYLSSDYRGKIIKAYEEEISQSNYSELTNQLLENLAEISELIKTLHDRKKLLKEILKIAVQVCKAERGIIFSVDEKTLDTSVEISHHVQEDSISDISDVNRKIINETFSRRKAVYHTEVLSDDSFDVYRSYVNINIQTIVCLPLMIHNKIIGTVYLDSSTLMAFSPEEMTFLNIFAQTAASAIETCQFYEKLQVRNKNLSTFLQHEKREKNAIIGNSESIQAVIKKMEQIASTDVHVLIEGESGTGKELVARGIHGLSQRSGKIFIPVDCGSLSEDLIETELFGYKKGAFTGANYDKKGLFEEANHGSIFLDEISNLSLHTQTKLLRLIQEGEFKRVGDNNIRKVDVRLIVASNIPLKQLVSENKFRQDLYFRLSIFPIEIPPLRERADDIRMLVHHFLNVFSALHQKDVVGIREKAMDILLIYPWPGNIRQLQNELERAVIVSTDAWLDESYFHHLKSDAESQPFSNFEVVDFNQMVDNYKASIIKEALRLKNNNWSQAADYLKISRQSMKRIYDRINGEE